MGTGSMTTAIDAFGLTDVGRKRKHNEDAYALEETEGLFIVADGMGGHAAGEVAAKITVETIGEFIAATRQKEEATWPFKYNHELDFNSNRLAVAIEKANERVMAAVAAQPWLKGMGTTVVAGLLNEKILSLAHVGDSRAYLFRDGELLRDSVAANKDEDSETLCQSLVDIANDKGGVDNITVVFVRIEDLTTDSGL